MKKFLPRTARNPQGFTLVELLVVITIIAILSIVGITIYTGVQKNARDAKRRSDIEAITKAIETRLMANNGVCPGQTTTQNGGTYCPLRDDWFAGGTVSTDPQGGAIITYCIQSNGTGTVINNPVAWTNTCPSGWVIPSQANTQPSLNSTTWKVCAALEAGGVYCRSNQQ